MKSVKEGKMISTLLGVVDSKKEEPQLVYLCEVDNSHAKDRNCLHLASLILNESRVIYLSNLLVLLRYFRPECIELAYLDTGNKFLCINYEMLFDISFRFCNMHRL